MKNKMNVIVATIVVFFTMTTISVAQNFSIVDTTIAEKSIMIDWQFHSEKDSTRVYADIYDASTNAYVSSLYDGRTFDKGVTDTISMLFDNGLQAGTMYRIVLFAQSTEQQDTMQLDISTLNNSLVVTSMIMNSISCNGGTALITVSAHGGYPPYMGTGAFAEFSGVHTFTVVDSRGYTTSTSVVITQPPVLIVSATTISNSISSGGTATVLVRAAGGIPPYTGTGVLIGATAEVQNFTVSDAHGCVATANNIVLTQPSYEVEDTKGK